MKVMGIDFSATSCGILIHKDPYMGAGFGEILAQEMAGHKMTKAANAHDRCLRIISVCERVITLIKEHKPDMVVIEGPSYGSRFKAIEIGGVFFSLLMQMRLAAGVIPTILPPTSARKKAFGAGAPPKSFPGKGTSRTKKWVKQELLKICGPKALPKNEHLRDALVLCLAAQAVDDLDF